MHPSMENIGLCYGFGLGVRIISNGSISILPSIMIAASSHFRPSGVEAATFVDRPVFENAEMTSKRESMNLKPAEVKIMVPIKINKTADTGTRK